MNEKTKKDVFFYILLGEDLNPAKTSYYQGRKLRVYESPAIAKRYAKKIGCKAYKLAVVEEI